MSDPILFLATLNFAAVHLDFVRGQCSNPRTLIHKVETIRLINARLQDPIEALTNTTIGAIIMLAGVEVRLRSCCDIIYE